MNRLLELLPPYERNSKTFQDIMNAEQIEFNKLNIDITDLEKQFNIDTTTWGLVIYEKELGIKTNLNKPLEERRSVVKSKWRGTGKADADLIKQVADSWTNGDVDVTLDGKINIKFNSVFGIPSNIEDTKKAIEEIKPAHLAYEFEYTYTVWNHLKQMTWNKANTMTWDELKVYEDRSDKN